MVYIPEDLDDCLRTKGVLLLFLSAYGAIFPYLPVYLRQVGLSASHVGLLIGIRPIVQVLSAPFWAILADRYKKRKAILVMSVLAWFVMTLAMAFVEPTNQLCEVRAGNETNSKVVNYTKINSGFFRRNSREIGLQMGQEYHPEFVELQRKTQVVTLSRRRAEPGYDVSVFNHGTGRQILSFSSTEELQQTKSDSLRNHEGNVRGNRAVQKIVFGRSKQSLPKHGGDDKTLLKHSGMATEREFQTNFTEGKLSKNKQKNELTDQTSANVSSHSINKLFTNGEIVINSTKSEKRKNDLKKKEIGATTLLSNNNTLESKGNLNEIEKDSEPFVSEGKRRSVVKNKKRKDLNLTIQATIIADDTASNNFEYKTIKSDSILTPKSKTSGGNETINVVNLASSKLNKTVSKQTGDQADSMSRVKLHEEPRHNKNKYESGVKTLYYSPSNDTHRVKLIAAQHRKDFQANNKTLQQEIIDEDEQLLNVLILAQNSTRTNFILKENGVKNEKQTKVFDPYNMNGPRQTSENVSATESRASTTDSRASAPESRARVSESRASVPGSVESHPLHTSVSVQATLGFDPFNMNRAETRTRNTSTDDHAFQTTLSNPLNNGTMAKTATKKMGTHFDINLHISLTKEDFGDGKKLKIKTLEEQSFINSTLTNTKFLSIVRARLKNSSQPKIGSNLQQEENFPVVITMRNLLKNNSSELRRIFVILLILIVVGEFLEGPSVILADAALLEHLGAEKCEYGKQRLWGSLGFGIFSCMVGLMLEHSRHVSCNEHYHDYMICFCVFAVLMVSALFITMQFNFDYVKATSDSKTTSNVFSLHYITVLFAACFLGVCQGLIHSFLTWFLEDLGASKSLIGIGVAFRCAADLVTFFLAGSLIQRFGQIKLISCSFLFYCVILLSYSFMSNPWFVIPVEMLTGFTYASSWCALTSYMACAAPADSLTTVQGILQGVYWGLGTGSGAIAGGNLIHQVGAVTTFRAASCMCIIVSCLFAIGQWRWPRKEVEPLPTKCAYLPSVEEKDTEALLRGYVSNKTTTQMKKNRRYQF